MKHILSPQSLKIRYIVLAVLSAFTVGVLLFLPGRSPLAVSHAQDAFSLSSDNYSYLLKWGVTGIGNGEFSSPFGVAVDSTNGRVYVADQANKRIQKFDLNGNYLSQWAALAKPYGIAIAPDGSVYVTDIKKHKVRHYDANGVLLKQWGGLGTATGKFNKPSGIAVDKNGNVYVADADNRRVQKFNANGKFLKTWNGTGSGSPAGLSYPYGIAVDGNSNVYVSDTSYHRIVKYTSNGVYVKKWGKQGSGDGKFKYPQMVAVDSGGNVYVADRDNSRIQKFSSSGTYLSKVGSFGAGDGQFNKPYGVGVAVSGDYIYVADMGNNRIQKLMREGLVTNTPTPSPTPTNTPTSTFTMFGTGADGDKTVGTGETFYTDDVRSGLSSSSSGNTVNVISITGFAAGQEVLIHQTRGTGAGQYEFAKISSVGIGQLILTSSLINAYVQDSTSRAQVVLVKQYSHVTVQNGGILTAHGWDGTSGGIIVFKTKETVMVQFGGIMQMQGRGFVSSVWNAPPDYSGKQGEGTAGQGGSESIAANGNGGGGGRNGNDAKHGGGGGGGNGAIGGTGQTVGQGVGGNGGSTSGSSDLAIMTFGGAGGTTAYQAQYGSAGYGGGIIFIMAKSLNISGGLNAGGQNAPDHDHGGDYGGGGGAGGSILLRMQNATLGTNLITAIGGQGSPSADTTYSGNGANGSVGRIRIEYCGSGSGTTNPPASVAIITCY